MIIMRPILYSPAPASELIRREEIRSLINEALREHLGKNEHLGKKKRPVDEATLRRVIREEMTSAR